jgi:hypothetical protein
MIVGINGKMNSGKSTTANILVSMGYKELSFADNLKQMCIHAFRLTEDQVYTQIGKQTKFEKPVSLNIFHLSDIVSWVDMVNRILVKGDQFTKMKRNLGRSFESPRDILQFVGTEICRECIDLNFHLNVLESQIKMHDNVVISDVRFHNELEFIKKLNGALVLVKDINQPQSESTHESEQDLPEEAFNFILVNDKSKGLDYLRSKVTSMVGGLCDSSRTTVTTIL